MLQKSLRATAVAVQGLCDAAPDAEHARAIAAAAAFGVKTPGIRQREDFYADILGNGELRLHAKAPGKKGERAFYDWQMNVNGTWVSLPSTNRASTLVQNLTPATQASFRHRTTIRDVPSAWSQTLVVLVH